MYIFTTVVFSLAIDAALNEEFSSSNVEGLGFRI